ncbi:response regulator transcription factor [Pseudonocardia sp. CA-107938]|uniref:response regulator transcription factor n=1 Tax=Pseudonocardia sp. CA-107938 TaxID=3240021 RepID=UPI003D8C73FF
MIRVLVAEDTGILRDTLVAVFDLQPDLEVVAQVAKGDAIVPEARRHRPDVAIVDIDLPVVDGLTATAQLRAEVPCCRVLILTAFARPGHLRTALAAGATGFLGKDTPAAELMAAVRRVAAGEQVVDHDLAVAALQSRDNPLTAREVDVLRSFAAGGSPPDIARELHLTVGTVRNYLAAAMVKLDARNRVDAVRIATEQGWM